MRWFSDFWRAFRSGKNVSRFLKGIVVAAIAFVLIFFTIAEITSRGFALIFNQEMQKQDMLRGTVTVEQIYMSPMGDVRFTNLVWQNPNGDTILEVPDGSFHLRLWDVVTRNFKSTTVQQLTLNGARIAIRFNKDMGVDFVRVDRKPRKQGDQTKKRKRSFQERVRNFNRNNRKLKVDVTLNDSFVEVRYLRRSYALNHVNLSMYLDTDSQAKLSLTTGEFGGTMIGEGMTVDGVADLTKDIPEMNIDFAFRGVDLSSLGFGVNLHDRMTFVVKAQGPVTDPEATGTVRMDVLNIKPLKFENVIGDVGYRDGKVHFSNVTAKIYNGRLNARGIYEVDSRKYTIYGNAKGLDSRYALRDMNFYCLVDARLALDCDGNPRNTLTYGTFKSSPGHYSIVPFRSLEGRFSNQNRKLDFYDVKITMPMGEVRTNLLQVKKGKVSLNYLTLVNPETGARREISGDRENQDSPVNIHENLQRFHDTLRDIKGDRGDHAEERP